MFRRGVLAALSTRRALLAGGAAAAVASYGTILYVNDDMDELRLPAWYRSAAPLAESERAKKTRLVVLGTGWGAMNLIRKLDLDDVDLTVVSPRPYFFYTPLLAGSATGTVSHANILEPVRKAVVSNGQQKATYIQGACSDVDFKGRTVRCRIASARQGGAGEEVVDVPYDKLVISVGAQPATFGIKGVKEHAHFLKELEHGIAVRSKVLSLMERASALQSTQGKGSSSAGTASDAEIDRLLHFVVVGGGPTGTELCGELSDLVKKDISKSFPDIADRVKITLVEGMPRILGMFDETLASYAQAHLESRNVDIRTNMFVSEVDGTTASLKHAKTREMASIPYGMLVWAAGITTRPVVTNLIRSIGMENGQDSRRGLVVDEYLRVKGIGDGSVYAIGDCAVSGLPPTAQVATQQGKYLGRELKREFARARTGIAETSISPVSQFNYTDKGKMAYIGGGEGVVELKLPAEKPEVDYNFWRAIHGAVGEPRFAGASGFMIWRSVYFSMLLSARNRLAIGSDWFRTSVFGRDITTPPQVGIGATAPRS